MKNILNVIKNLFGNKKGLAKAVEILEQCFDKQFCEELEEARKKVREVFQTEKISPKAAAKALVKKYLVPLSNVPAPVKRSVGEGTLHMSAELQNYTKKESYQAAMDFVRAMLNESVDTDTASSALLDFTVAGRTLLELEMTKYKPDGTKEFQYSIADISCENIRDDEMLYKVVQVYYLVGECIGDARVNCMDVCNAFLAELGFDIHCAVGVGV